MGLNGSENSGLQGAHGDHVRRRLLAISLKIFKVLTGMAAGAAPGWVGEGWGASALVMG